uniref:Tetraspanin n=1 Tax=Amblyomma americanum TaxID=6943 RepID=A0A0C9QY30_AMBAM
MGKLLQTAVCINLMKLLLMTFNIIFGVTGLVLLILGVWMNVSLYHLLKLSADYNRHMPLLFIATGLLVLLVAVLACVATAKGQSALLYIVREGIGRGMNSSLTHYTGSGGMADETVDFVQGKLSCCGLNSPDDWTNTNYYQEHDKHYPKSCCSGSGTCEPDSATVYSEGCYVKVIRFLDTNLNAIAGGAVGFAFFQLLGVLLSFCLASNINKAKYERV